ncbi:MAG: sensor histidine kinase [Candidatus Limnocylindrales bacterium]
MTDAGPGRAGRDRWPGWTRGVGARIALAAVVTTALAVGVVSFGVVVVGGAVFADLMMKHGATAETAHAMFDQSITLVLLAAIAAAIGAGVILAIILGRRLARPLAEIGSGARAVAAGDYRVRVPRRGPEEIASLADSFNQMAASLEEQERMRREFIANAAHELRTPLTNLQGYLEGMRDGVIPADRATFDSLWDEAERLVRLAASLDTLAEGDSGSRRQAATDVDVAGAIRTAVDLATPGLERAGLAVELELPERLPARANPDALAQVLGNLLQNATRYTPSGGLVAIRAERRPADILVSIVNSGGIPADEVAHVFERFYRVDKSRDRAHGGAGIGLSIVQQLIEAAGGHVGAESHDGTTMFWFALPA